MTELDRRSLLMAGTGAFALPQALSQTLARAAAIDAHVATGTLADVQHVVIFMQENRAFDHYFGTLNGVRGFADPHPIPLADTPSRRSATVWLQTNSDGDGHPPVVAPFPLNTTQTFAHMRVEGTPHNWPDAQSAWNEGRIDHWAKAKGAHAMGYFEASDIPFQFALADAFTVCDAYHCAMQTGTNTNRLMLWTGTNDPAGVAGGPSISNSHDNFASLGGAKEPYTWTTYVQRLSAAGVSWRIYQDMADNFTDNPLAGFKAFRDAHEGAPGADMDLKDRAISTRKLDALRADVLAGQLPQVSYIIAPAAASEHPGPSSPAQGADYTAQVIEALSADPKVWAKTVLLVMYDENDGYFDHAPPPAPPSREGDRLLGGSTVSTEGEYHQVKNPTEAPYDRPELMGRPYGLGPRVPMFILSPWSRGGWVNSEVFDHTSVIRFLEARFGVAEPNISPWRRAVCGDLTSAFNFATPNLRSPRAKLPATAELAHKAAALPKRTTPPIPATPGAAVQAHGPRPARPLPYALDIRRTAANGGVQLDFINQGQAGAVFHVYDRHHLDAAPRRYTVEAGKTLSDHWDSPSHDLWVLGPNGFHRHFISKAADQGPGDDPVVSLRAQGRSLVLTLINPAPETVGLFVGSPAYGAAVKLRRINLKPGASASRHWSLAATGGWYDLVVTSNRNLTYLHRLAGHIETGRASVTDPAMHGPARLRQWPTLG